MRLPGHAESYNPPPEYVPNDNEKKQWESLADEPYKRKLNFLPQKFDCLRKVPAYEKFINERFERQLGKTCFFIFNFAARFYVTNNNFTFS